MFLVAYDPAPLLSSGVFSRRTARATSCPPDAVRAVISDGDLPGSGSP